MCNQLPVAQHDPPGRKLIDQRVAVDAIIVRLRSDYESGWLPKASRMIVRSLTRAPVDPAPPGYAC